MQRPPSSPRPRRLRERVSLLSAACLVASHDPDAVAFADRVLRLVDGELTEWVP